MSNPASLLSFTRKNCCHCGEPLTPGDGSGETIVCAECRDNDRAVFAPAIAAYHKKNPLDDEPDAGSND